MHDRARKFITRIPSFHVCPCPAHRCPSNDPYCQHINRYQVDNNELDLHLDSVSCTSLCRWFQCTHSSSQPWWHSLSPSCSEGPHSLTRNIISGRGPWSSISMSSSHLPCHMTGWHFSRCVQACMLGCLRACWPFNVLDSYIHALLVFGSNLSA